MFSPLMLRHIQVTGSNSTIEPHWGYVGRVLPCTSDAGSCEYLDGVYWMHDVSMLYTFILWAVIGVVLAIMFALQAFRPSAAQRTKKSRPSIYSRAWRGARAYGRKWLLPESFIGVFGNVTRLQLVVLASLLSYLLIFSLVGIVYKSWFTPVKGTSPVIHNRRTGLGGFSDRVGTLAYALTPLTILLATRESILTLITGLPYQSFTFLHRWLGRIIFVQSILHTFGWTLIEGKYYKPQPMVYGEFVKQKYIIWGCVAVALICFLFIFSFSNVIKRTGHEFFRKTHYIVAGLYMGACWAHWNHLACWMIASLGIFGLDRGLRLLRTGLMHIGCLPNTKSFGFRSAESVIEYFDDQDGGVVRMEFSHNHDPWAVGQHYFLTFPALTIWQSHPLTVASVPAAHPALPHHVYIIRCRCGETGRLKKLVLEDSGTTKTKIPITTGVILSGPYGTPFLKNPECTNILAIAGGTGVSLTLPVITAATSLPIYADAAMDFIWIIRRASNIEWIGKEMEELKRRAARSNLNLRIHIFITQETNASPITNTSKKTSLEIDVTTTGISPSLSSKYSLETSTNFSVTYLQPNTRPILSAIVRGFIEERAAGSMRTRVVASGPNSMGRDLRSAVAEVNDAGAVWRGDWNGDVGLDWDDRGA